MKIANVQIYQVCDRSEFVEVDDADIETLRNWEAYPYTGKTEAELAAYIAGLADEIDGEEPADDVPDVAVRLHKSFWGDNVTKTQLWNSSTDRPDSKITVFNDEEKELGEAASQMM